MNKARDNAKQRARELRQEGKTIHEIKSIVKEELGVECSVGSIHGWTSEIKVTQTGTRIKKEVKNEIEIKKDGSMDSTKDLQLTEEELKDPEALLRKHGFDPLKYEMVNARNTEWNAQLKGGKVTTFYASKLTVKPIKAAIGTDIFKELVDELKFDNIWEKTQYNLGKEYCVIEIRDLHHGLLAWAEEVGGNYDYKISSKLFSSAIDYYLEKIKQRDNTKKIILVTGDDFFHIDNIVNTTAAGTPQDVDVRWAKMYKTGVKLLTEAVEKLSDVAPVYMPLVMGNHDTMTMYHAQLLMEAYFKDNDNVEIDTMPSIRKYLKLGNTALGLTHGKISDKNLKGIMQVEAPEYWSDCKFKEMHMGHYHSEKSEEHGGVIYRWNPTLCGSSSYEHNAGYSSQTASLMYIYDEEKGLTTVEKFNPDMIKDKSLHKELNTNKEISTLKEL